MDVESQDRHNLIPDDVFEHRYPGTASLEDAFSAPPDIRMAAGQLYRERLLGKCDVLGLDEDTVELLCEALDVKDPGDLVPVVVDVTLIAEQIAEAVFNTIERKGAIVKGQIFDAAHAVLREQFERRRHRLKIIGLAVR